MWILLAYVPLTCLSLTSEVVELILQRRILERDQEYVPVTVRTLNVEALKLEVPGGCARPACLPYRLREQIF